jgi:pyruvate dehydrogenase complex dehydrogenase (E1) component
MSYTLTNLTDASRNDNPASGDFLEYAYDNGTTIRKHYNAPTELLQEEIESIARAWRDSELSLTDWVVPLTDHPQRSAYMAYRQALREWPSTSNFPATKPTL